MKRDGNRIIVDSSECVMISFLTNASWENDRIIRGEKLTHAEYEMKDYEKWVRVEIKDSFRKYAWSNFIMMEN